MKEIERKFLLRDGTFPKAHETWDIEQGYLSLDPAVRVRCLNQGGFITIKGPTQGITRQEWEYPISHRDAKEMLQLCQRRLSKTRCFVKHEAHVWEVDVFHGDNKGLVVAEIELAHADEEFALPPWIGVEVSHLPQYLNSNLTIKPFCQWVRF